MTIAFLGAGLMGAAFVRHFLDAGEEVRVWNRSADKARALEADGAKAFTEAAAALQGADRVHLSLGDDASIDAVLEPIADAIAPATWIVDHSTTAPTLTAARIARWDARGRRYVHAPVFMAPANARDGTGVMLVSGEASRCEALRPALEKMTGKVIYLGPAPERAAAFKLFGNLVLTAITGVLGDVNRLAHALGIPTAEAMDLFKHFNPGAVVPMRAAKIAAADFDRPTFEMVMARKDVRLILEEAARGGVELRMMPAVAAMFDAGIARGEGHRDATAAARV